MPKSGFSSQPASVGWVAMRLGHGAHLNETRDEVCAFSCLGVLRLQTAQRCGLTWSLVQILQRIQKERHGRIFQIQSFPATRSRDMGAENSQPAPPRFLRVLSSSFDVLSCSHQLFVYGSKLYFGISAHVSNEFLFLLSRR